MIAYEICKDNVQISFIHECLERHAFYIQNTELFVSVVYLL